ncbi:MAG: methyltransferase domain-containing protein [Anaerolineae bacterium]
MLRIDYRSLPKYEVPCACCGSMDYQVARRGDRFKFGLRTVVCTQCGLLFTSPRPSAEWFDEFYRFHYRKYYEAVDQPDETYLNRDWIRGRHLRNIDILAPHLKPVGMLLDIGCAEGTFLHAFGERFPDWHKIGIDPSESFTAFARSHFHLDNIHQGNIQALTTWDAEQFDLITAGHVLEHLLDPNEFFILCRRLLKPDGLLFIDVPDTESGIRGLQNIHIGHVYHFTRSTISNFLAKHGFGIVAIQSDSTPHPWTMLVIGAKQLTTPTDWKPQPVDSSAIKRRFYQHTSLSLKTKLYMAYRRTFPRGLRTKSESA